MAEQQFVLIRRRVAQRETARDTACANGLRHRFVQVAAGALFLIAPAVALSADHAERARGKEVYEVVKDKGVLAAVRRIMPVKDFEVWSTWATTGVSAPMEERDGVVYGFGCQPHNCATVHARLALDHQGGVWASLTEDGENTRYYGAPPAHVKGLLTLGN